MENLNKKISFDSNDRQLKKTTKPPQVRDRLSSLAAPKKRKAAATQSHNDSGMMITGAIMLRIISNYLSTLVLGTLLNHLLICNFLTTLVAL